MNELPRMSLITIVRNSATTIATAVESILTQNYPNLEYVVVDGASNDGTKEILESYKKHFSVFISEPDRGPIDAINKAGALVSGEIVSFIMADDFSPPGTLKAVADEFQSNSGIDVIHGDFRYHYHPLGKVIRCKPFPGWEENRFMWPSLFVITLFLRQQAFRNVLPFDPRFTLASDFEFYLKLRQMGTRFHYLDRVLVEMRSGGRSYETTEGYRELREIAIRYGCPKFKARLSYLTKLVERVGNKLILRWGGRAQWEGILRIFRPNLIVEGPIPATPPPGFGTMPEQKN